MTTITIERNVDEVNKSPSLYSMTGDIKHVNTMMVNRHALSEVLAHIDAQSAEIERLRAALAAPATFDIDVETLIEIVTDIRQHINHGVASEKFEALQRPGYGTGIYTHISNQLNKIMAILAEPATAPDRHAQELLAQDITIANMEARHAEELAAYELTVANLRAELAKPVEHVETITTDIAVKRLCKALRDDLDYAWSWHCNVAMTAYDAGCPHDVANEGAARFMQLLAGVDTRERFAFSGTQTKVDLHTPAWHDAPEAIALKAERDELLDALKEIERAMYGEILVHDGQRAAFESARAAIAKAEGRTE